jgi:hypothetical protein
MLKASSTTTGGGTYPGSKASVRRRIKSDKKWAAFEKVNTERNRKWEEGKRVSEMSIPNQYKWAAGKVARKTAGAASKVVHAEVNAAKSVHNIDAIKRRLKAGNRKINDIALHK